MYSKVQSIDPEVCESSVGNAFQPLSALSGLKHVFTTLGVSIACIPSHSRSRILFQFCLYDSGLLITRVITFHIGSISVKHSFRILAIRYNDLVSFFVSYFVQMSPNCSRQLVSLLLFQKYDVIWLHIASPGIPLLLLALEFHGLSPVSCFFITVHRL